MLKTFFGETGTFSLLFNEKTSEYRTLSVTEILSVIGRCPLFGGILIEK